MSGIKYACARLGYDGHDVLRNVALDVAPGERLFLVGDNGAGKSTLLRSMAGVADLPDAIEIDGQDLRAASARQWALSRVYIGQRPAAMFGYRVAEVISWGGYAKDEQVAIEVAAREAGVSDLLDKRISELSGGQLGRVLIARAIAQGCSTWFIDEADAALDANGREWLYRYLQSSAKTLVAVTHDLALARQHATRVARISNGAVTLLAPEEL